MAFFAPPSHLGNIHPKVLELYTRPQYAQRTPEWYDVRRGLITASEAASAMNVKPFAGFKGSPREELMLTKLNKPRSFTGMAMQHGIAYEDEACAFAMDKLGKKHLEFGLIVHKDYPWLAASPDGLTTDGLCVEIKCPTRRKIIPGVVPHHYIPQIQVQMEVCDVEETIFIQYKPAHMSETGEPFADITFVKRDREWFEQNKQILQQFWEELVDRRKTHIPEEGKPDENVLEIVDGLYTTELDYTREYGHEENLQTGELCFIDDDVFTTGAYYKKQFN
ncbi:hypothetical protein ATCVNTS1_776R [Acanthocystis turfacea Chlorella virus NTS-1]|nr:hypothetical protein ATCVNTS1_776R [Acanthocystis turfacea Chlorella virus NTS-1]